MQRYPRYRLRRLVGVLLVDSVASGTAGFLLAHLFGSASVLAAVVIGLVVGYTISIADRYWHARHYIWKDHDGCR